MNNMVLIEDDGEAWGAYWFQKCESGAYSVQQVIKAPWGRYLAEAMEDEPNWPTEDVEYRFALKDDLPDCFIELYAEWLKATLVETANECTSQEEDLRERADDLHEVANAAKNRLKEMNKAVSNAELLQCGKNIPSII